MHDPEIPFAAPVATAGLPGFPDRLAGVAEARRVVLAARLPRARSCHAWVEAHALLTLALANRGKASVEAARLALVRAVAREGCSPRPGYALAA